MSICNIGALTDALIEVDSRQQGYLSQEKYRKYRDESHPTLSEIIHFADDRGWNDMKREAGIEIPPTLVSAVTVEEAIQAVQTVSERVDGEMTLSVYERERDDSHPHGSTVAKRHGWSAIKHEAGLDHREWSTSITEESAVTAMCAVSDRVEGRLTIAKYDEARDAHHPSGHGISDKLGWRDMMRAAGLFSR